MSLESYHKKIYNWEYFTSVSWSHRYVDQLLMDQNGSPKSRVQYRNGLREWDIYSPITCMLHFRFVGVSFHHPHECLFKSLSWLTTNKLLKLRIIGPLCWDPPAIDGFPTQRTHNLENVHMSWRHHVSTNSVTASNWSGLTPVITLSPNPKGYATLIRQ